VIVTWLAPNNGLYLPSDLTSTRWWLQWLTMRDRR